MKKLTKTEKTILLEARRIRSKLRKSKRLSEMADFDAMPTPRKIPRDEFIRRSIIAGEFYDLGGHDLSGINLRGAFLEGADLTDVNLSDSDLSGASLEGADLTGADLRGADLRRADLTDAELSEARLDGANLLDAKMPVGWIQTSRGNPLVSPSGRRSKQEPSDEFDDPLMAKILARDY